MESPYFDNKDTNISTSEHEIKSTELTLPRNANITEIRAKVLCDKWINEVEFIASGEPIKGEISAKLGEDN